MHLQTSEISKISGLYAEPSLIKEGEQQFFCQGYDYRSPGMGKRDVRGSTELKVGRDRKGRAYIYRRKLLGPLKFSKLGFLARMLNIFMKIRMMFEVTTIYHFVSPVVLARLRLN
jgi:hypothetical protein